MRYIIRIVKTIRLSGVIKKMVIRKAFNVNKSGTTAVTIPSKMKKEMGITQNTYFEIDRVGNSIHINVVVIQ
jgi:hypothetical protein